MLSRRMSSFFNVPPPPPPPPDDNDNEDKGDDDDEDDELPSWDPQTPFCFPVKGIPAKVQIPVDLTMEDFNHVAHLADGRCVCVYHSISG